MAGAGGLLYPPPDPVVCWENACRITGVIRPSVMPVRHLIAKCQGLILPVMVVVTMATRSITPVAAVAMSMISMMLMLKLSVLSMVATRTITPVTSVSVSVLAMMPMGMGVPSEVECQPSIPVVSNSVVAYLSSINIL